MRSGMSDLCSRWLGQIQGDKAASRRVRTEPGDSPTAFAMQILSPQRGASQFLVQQFVNRYGHCNLKPEEILNSFQDLLLWVNFGITPPGGDVTVP